MKNTLKRWASYQYGKPFKSLTDKQKADVRKTKTAYEKNIPIRVTRRAGKAYHH